MDGPRNVCTFVPPTDDPRDPLGEMVEIRDKERKWTRVQRKKVDERERDIDESAEYPPTRSFDDKAEIIRQWQAAMDPKKLTRGVCRMRPSVR